MGLVDKLKNTGKAILIAGGLSGMAYNSGCLELAVLGAGKMIADSNVKAAEIQAQNNQVYYSSVSSQNEQKLPGILISSVADINNNNMGDKSDPILSLEQGVYNNSIMLFCGLREKYFGRKFRYTLKDEEGSVADETFILNDEVHPLYSKIFAFSMISFKKDMEQRGFRNRVRGIKRFQVEYFKNDELLPSDSKSFLVNFDTPYR